jgi:carbonic anhydrase/acetyltransferase-like protein (isoleucine patch superfamily)
MQYTNYEQKLSAKVQKGHNVFLAPNATVLGSVTLGNQASVWYHAVVRGDSDAITIGDRTNVQDGAIIHVDPGVPVEVGHNCILGHAAIVHGATIGNHSLVGMRATILNNARIGNWCIVGAHSLVTEGKVFPDYSVIMGSPAKVVRTVTEADMEALRQNAQTYVDKAEAYSDSE